MLKLLAEQSEYFVSNWNKLDFFIVACADLALLIDLFIADSVTIMATVSMILKVVRILRVLRLIRLSKKLRVLLDSLVVILPSIANVGSLILLMFFIFAVIGMNMFNGVIHQTELNENNNFSSFGMSLVILMRCATGEKWNNIMRELAVTQESFRMNIYVHNMNYVNSNTNIDYNRNCLES